MPSPRRCARATARLRDVGEQRHRRRPAGRRAGRGRRRARRAAARRRRAGRRRRCRSRSAPPASRRWRCRPTSCAGPKGVGALVARDPARLRPLIWGGGQEAGAPLGHRERARDRRLRGGAGGDARPAATSRRALRDRLESGWARRCRLSRPAPSGCPAMCCCASTACAPTCVVLALDEAGYEVSAGLGLLRRRRRAQPCAGRAGDDAEEARCVIRVTIGRDTSRPRSTASC